MQSIRLCCTNYEPACGPSGGRNEQTSMYLSRQLCDLALAQIREKGELVKVFVLSQEREYQAGVQIVNRARIDDIANDTAVLVLQAALDRKSADHIAGIVESAILRAMSEVEQLRETTMQQAHHRRDMFQTLGHAFYDYAKGTIYLPENDATLKDREGKPMKVLKPHKVDPPQWAIDKLANEEMICDMLSKRQAERIKKCPE